MSQRKYSLRWELLLDLALLTFCALIMSSGLLIVLLRVSLPDEVEPSARISLVNIHQQFINSQAFQSAMSLEEAQQVEALPKAFELFKSQADLNTYISFRLATELMPEPGFDMEYRNFLFVIPASHALHYEVPFEGLGFHYQFSFEPLHVALSRYKYFVFIAAILITLVLVFLGYHLLFRKNILVPLKNLSKTANSFLQEDWEARALVHRKDELGNIAEVLNEMARMIQEKEKKLVLTIQSLQKANEEIEVTKNEQLQIEKLASVGRLAAGVAHEVGNPLGAISGYTDILRSILKDQPQVSAEDVELCDRIEAETNRISKIIRALLQQARPPQDRIRPVKLEPVVKRSVDLAQIPESISVQYDLDSGAEVLCERDQLVQVVLNLLINARHAIEAKKQDGFKGEIKIRLVSRKLPLFHDSSHSDEVSLDTSIVRSLKAQRYWVLSISDNGTGISKEDQKKLFEPFFSTKEPGKGTGLGLYVSKSIIESFRGTIVVQSADGYGTSFSVLLPKDL